MSRPVRTRSSLLSLAGLTLLLVGCFERTGEPGTGKGSGSQSAAPTAVADGTGVAGSDAASFPFVPPPLRETFETIYWQGSPVGTMRTAYYAEVLDGRPVVRIESGGTLTFLRYGQKIEQQIRDVTWETATGDVVRLENFLLAGSAPQQVTGVIANGEATITLRTAGKTEIERLQWPKGTGGSTAPLDSLRRKPLLAGETRSITLFMPILNRVATVKMKAQKSEQIDVGGTAKELLRIDCHTEIVGSPPLESIIWTDADGEVWKNEMPAVGQTSIRTTSAETISASPTFDIGKLTMVKLASPLADAHHTKSVRYKIRLRDGDPSVSFPNSEGQRLLKSEEGAAEIAVLAIRPTTVPQRNGYEPTPPIDGDRRPSALVQSDDDAVKKLAVEAGGNDTDPWDVAVRCEKLISAKMHSVNFSTAFATAAETAKTLSGDCTEHAVLLCAVLRVRGIPSRTVVGLVYVEQAQAFGYHMWTEAWIGERWIALDATLGRGGISAAYLKIADTNLEGVDSFAAFLPVFPLLGRLQIEVLERE